MKKGQTRTLARSSYLVVVAPTCSRDVHHGFWYSRVRHARQVLPMAKFETCLGEASYAVYRGTNKKRATRRLITLDTKQTQRYIQ